MIILVLETVNILQYEILTEHHKVQNSLNFRSNEEILDLLITLLPEVNITVLFPEPTLEIDITLENKIRRIDFHRDHVQNLYVDL